MNSAVFRLSICALILAAVPALSRAEQGLIAHYTFDEGTGTVAADSSGNGYAGTLVNSPAWTPGVKGSGLSFNGSNTYVNVPNSPDVGGGSFSVSAWIYRQSDAERKFVSKWNTSGSLQFDCQIYSDAKLWFQIMQTDLNYKLARGTTVIATQRWYHVVMVADTAAQTLSIYLNGVPETLQAAPGWNGTVVSLNMPLNIGRKAGAVDYWNGKIDEVRIYNRALTQADVTALNQAPPLAMADSYSTLQDQPLTVAAPGVLSNDSEPNGDTVTAIKDTDPAHGTLSLSSNGAFTYTPQTGYTGIDTFTYHGNDGKGNDSPPATVTIDVSNFTIDSVTPAVGYQGQTLLTVAAGGTGFKASTFPQGAVMFNGHGYFFVTSLLSWPESKLYCENNGGHLATIGSAAENTFVQSLISPSVSLAWIGYWAEVHGGGYKWVNGETVVYTNWGGGEPNGGNVGPSDFTVMRPQNGLWNDTGSDRFGFVCEFENVTAVKLKKGATTIVATNIKVTDSTHLSFDLDLSSAETGFYDVEVTNPNGTVATLPIGFEVKPPPPTLTSVANVTAIFKPAAQNVTLNATVTSPFGNVNGGNITFQLKDGQNNIGTPVTSTTVLNSAVAASYTLPASLPLGVYAIEAAYSGFGNFPASTDNSHTVTVQLAAANLSVTSIALPQSGTDQVATLSATLTSTAGVVNEGTVACTVKNGATVIGSPASAPVSNGSASVSYTIPGGTALGTYVIEASFTATNFAPATDNGHTLNIVEQNSMSAENASIPYKTSGQNVSLNASIVGAGGTVNEGTVTFQVKNGAINVGAAATSPIVSNGVASASYSLPAGTPAGTYAIFASYSGGPNFPPASDNSRTLTITRAATAANPSNVNTPYSFADQTVALSIPVTSSAGTVNEGTVTVQIKSGAQNLGNAVTSAAITNGTASISYTIPGGTLPGIYSIEALYGGGANFFASSDNVKTLTILKASPVIIWPSPADIAYGTALGPTQLNAGTGGIPGTYAYNPADGTILAVGNAQQLSVTFTPTDTVNYNTTQKTVTINVTKKLLTVTADNQSKLFGAPNPLLTASYSGFVTGESAAALTGAPTLSTSVTTSTPPGNYPITIAQGTLNAANYVFTFVNGSLTVSNTPAFFNLSAPNVPYATPTTTLSGKISFGAAGAASITFNGVSKSAVIDGSGFFSADFSTASVELGTYPIDYFYPGGGAVGPATDTKTLTIIKATPALVWANPAEIPYGTPLSATQLNATAAIAGTFAYTPPGGTVLAKGTHQLSVDFTPQDGTHYVSATASATLVVGLAQAAINWATPADISYGSALSDTQLNATADIAGTFAYNPPLETILDAGEAQTLSLIFTPDDNVNYATSRVDVFINVLKADQSIAFAQIADQEIGSPALTLSATASSNLPVTISLVSGNATLQGNSLTLTGLGTITLRAEQAGDSNFNAAPTLEQTFHVIIIPPHITSAFSASGTQNQAFTFKLTAGGTQPVTFESGTLPAGLSLNANSGDIAGTPAGSGAFQIAVTARNGGGTDTKTLTLVFASSGGGENHAPKFTSGVLATPNPATVNFEVAFTASASDEDGDSVAIVWDFGDGTQGYGSTATHKYASTGIFAAKATLTDGVASDYLNLTVVVNASVIPPDQYKQYVVSKLALKFNFAKPNTDSLSISGTIPVPAAFSPEGKVVKFESGELERQWTLDKKATSADKAFKLTGKFAKDGTLTGSPAKFALALKNQDLFTALSPLGFANDNTPKGMIVPMPVIFVVEGIGYLATIDVKYAAKKGKSGSGKK